MKMSVDLASRASLLKSYISHILEPVLSSETNEQGLPSLSKEWIDLEEFSSDRSNTELIQDLDPLQSFTLTTYSTLPQLLYYTYLSCELIESAETFHMRLKLIHSICSRPLLTRLLDLISVFLGDGFEFSTREYIGSQLQIHPYSSDPSHPLFYVVLRLLRYLCILPSTIEEIVTHLHQCNPRLNPLSTSQSNHNSSNSSPHLLEVLFGQIRQYPSIDFASNIESKAHPSLLLYEIIELLQILLGANIFEWNKCGYFIGFKSDDMLLKMKTSSLSFRASFIIFLLEDYLTSQSMPYSISSLVNLIPLSILTEETRTSLLSILLICSQSHYFTIEERQKLTDNVNLNKILSTTNEAPVYFARQQFIQILNNNLSKFDPNLLPSIVPEQKISMLTSNPKTISSIQSFLANETLESHLVVKERERQIKILKELKIYLQCKH
jgi:hypothetical protein